MYPLCGVIRDVRGSETRIPLRFIRATHPLGLPEMPQGGLIPVYVYWDFLRKLCNCLIVTRHSCQNLQSPLPGDIFTMTTVQTQIPDQLWQQAQTMVQQGWVANLDELIAESVRRYLESHLDTMNEQFIREDIDWGLHGQD